MAYLQFEGVSKSYGNGAVAVTDFSLEVNEGEFVVILGPSGCGKTTILKMVNRLVEPSSGAVYIAGHSILQMDPIPLRRRIGYVIQQVGLFPHMTIGENVAVVPSLMGKPKTWIEHRVDELLHLVGLPPAEFKRRYPAELSGGQAQRVGVARALAGDPDILLMDEPLGSLDAITRTRLQDEIREIQQKLNKTILFVTHDVEEALNIADRIAVMKDGRLVQYGEPAELLNAPADDFVLNLIAGDEMMRQFRLMRLETRTRDTRGSSLQ